MTLIQFYPVVRVANNGWKPNVDILETDEGFVLNAEIPGLKREDVSLTLKDDILTLKGEKKRESTTDKDNYQLNERKFGQFSRSFILPDFIESEKIRTSFKDGLLRVSILKPEVVKKRELKVEFN
jgi:HSP20 family protein